MVSMMNTKSLLAACLVSFVASAVGVAYAMPGPATSRQEAFEPTQSVSNARDAIPAPEVIFVASEVVIVGRAPAKKHAGKAKKSYVCGGWQDSQIGGSYKRCEWK